MNGATALPCASTSSAPTINITNKMGSSQYFLRVRRKAPNSLRNESIGSLRLELIHHRIGRRSGRLALDPVALGSSIGNAPQRVFAESAEQQSNRRHD